MVIILLCKIKIFFFFFFLNNFLYFFLFCFLEMKKVLFVQNNNYDVRFYRYNIFLFCKLKIIVIIIDK